jgi:hypothetical protein
MLYRYKWIFSSGLEIKFYFAYLCAHYYGRLAEWLGSGLQNRVRRFESAIDLKSILMRMPEIAKGFQAFLFIK